MRTPLLTALTLQLACQAPPAMPEHTNALAGETSPYLLQHARNPVDWHPWGAAALERAAAEDKLVIVSIGYAACHWCHVMERESFEDSTVARVMNEHYVSVKVDREERPDVDDVYMTACHLSSGGSCGWPLNAVALPDGRPVWAGTYFPRGRWIEILEYFVALRQNEPEKLEAYAAQLAQRLRGEGARPPVDGADVARGFDRDIARRNAERLVALSDLRHGGLGGAPKFPLPVAQEFALTYAALSGDRDCLPQVHHALTRMARGGIYDQLGGGFARYSVDAAWHVPHFEKMLYDNAQLVSLYSHAVRSLPPHDHANAEELALRAEYERVVRETVAFVARELTAPSGLFYSSLDADSEGVEGKFYVWTLPELREHLSADELELVIGAYGITEEGNWEEGVNVLHARGDDDALAADLGLSPTGFRQNLDTAREKLSAARAERVRPGLDDKALVAWNALMIVGLVDAYFALGDEAFRASALRAAKAVVDTFLQTDGRLLRTSAKGRTHVNAFLDDYAHLAVACLAVYQASFEAEWLARARELVDYALERFAHETSPLFYFTSDLDEQLVARRVDDADNVIPSSNATLADALLTLGELTGEQGYIDRARAMVRAVESDLAAAEQPAYHGRWLQVQARLAYPRFEVAVVGAGAEATALRLTRSALLPQAVLVGSLIPTDHPELLAGKGVPGETLIYVCRDRACRLPTGDPAVALSQLQAGFTAAD